MFYASKQLILEKFQMLITVEKTVTDKPTAREQRKERADYKPTDVKSLENWLEVRTWRVKVPGEGGTKAEPDAQLSSARLSSALTQGAADLSLASERQKNGAERGGKDALKCRASDVGDRRRARDHPGGGALTVNVSFQVGPAGLRLERR